MVRREGGDRGAVGAWVAAADLPIKAQQVDTPNVARQIDMARSVSTPACSDFGAIGKEPGRPSPSKKFRWPFLLTSSAHHGSLCHPLFALLEIQIVALLQGRDTTRSAVSRVAEAVLIAGQFRTVVMQSGGRMTRASLVSRITIF